MIQIKTIPTTADFLSLLEKHPEQGVVFHLGEGKTVPEGYHLTELKAVEFNTVDCGGTVNHWHNTIIQLWRSKHSNETGYMTAAKWLAIYRKVASLSRIQTQNEVLFEYGDDGTPAVHYQVQDMYSQDGQIHVMLNWMGVRCKALDRGEDAPACGCETTDSGKSACCS